jgi:hypothetical protein
MRLTGQMLIVKAIRFAFFFLEATFKKMSDDGFSSEKAMVVLGCAQVAAIFTAANTLVIMGVGWAQSDFGFGVALVVGVLIVVANYRILKGDLGLDFQRAIYRKGTKTQRNVGGVIVLVVVAVLIVTFIVSAGLVADLEAETR